MKTIGRTLLTRYEKNEGRLDLTAREKSTFALGATYAIKMLLEYARSTNNSAGVAFLTNMVTTKEFIEDLEADTKAVDETRPGA